MWPLKRTKRIEDIPTDLGNALLRDLLSSGWRIVDQYPDHMFDKGIDYDSYTLKGQTGKLEFEWSNWDEWSILGSEESVDLLLSLYPWR